MPSSNPPNSEGFIVGPPPCGCPLRTVPHSFNLNGAEILTTETYQTGETDFSTQLTQIKEANPWAAQSYAALYILAEAIANAQSTDPTAIRDVLANIKNFDIVLGQFSFNAVGDAVYDLMVLIVQNGNFEVFE